MPAASQAMWPRRRRGPGQIRPGTVVPERESAVQSARKVGLRYVSDGKPGIRRERLRGRFRYVDPAGKPIKDQATLARIKALGIPPAWREGWIWSQSNGHV